MSTATWLLARCEAGTGWRGQVGGMINSTTISSWDEILLVTFMSRGQNPEDLSGAGEMQQRIWTEGELPFLKCGFAALASVVTDQTDKAAFSKC